MGEMRDSILHDFFFSSNSWTRSITRKIGLNEPIKCFAFSNFCKQSDPHILVAIATFPWYKFSDWHPFPSNKLPLITFLCYWRCNSWSLWHYVTGQLVVCTLCSCVMKTKQIWLFSAHMVPLLARLCLVPIETIVVINKFAMIFTGLEVLYFLASNLLVPFNLAKSAYRELVQVKCFE